MSADDRLAQHVRDLETRVAELERRELMTRPWCARCSYGTRASGNCFNCCRDLCSSCMAEQTCSHSSSGAHTERR